jgi:3-oxoacyl-[acyl-carrier protein] reductase
MVLKDKVALVTGSTRGIGKQIADDFEKLGVKVIRTGRRNLNLLEDDTIIIDKIKSLIDYYKHIDILVNSAGINYRTTIQDYPLEQYDNLNKVNLKAIFLISKEISKSMIKNNYGRIVNIASTSSIVSMPERSIYSLTKSGLVGLTRGMALDLAKYNILVNCVSPGPTFTDMTRKLGKDRILEFERDIPLGRLANTNEISNLVTFLCSDLNTYITGQNIVIDGGYTCK